MAQSQLKSGSSVSTRNEEATPLTYESAEVLRALLGAGIGDFIKAWREGSVSAPVEPAGGSDTYYFVPLDGLSGWGESPLTHNGPVEPLPPAGDPEEGTDFQLLPDDGSQNSDVVFEVPRNQWFEISFGSLLGDMWAGGSGLGAGGILIGGGGSVGRGLEGAFASASGGDRLDFGDFQLVMLSNIKDLPDLCTDQFGG